MPPRAEFVDHHLPLRIDGTLFPQAQVDPHRSMLLRRFRTEAAPRLDLLFRGVEALKMSWDAHYSELRVLRGEEREALRPYLRPRALDLQGVEAYGFGGDTSGGPVPDYVVAFSAFASLDDVPSWAPSSLTFDVEGRPPPDHPMLKLL